MVDQGPQSRLIVADLFLCSRIVAADGYIGGFGGEWGTAGSKKQKGSGANCVDKLELLREEGVFFDSRGYLLKGKGSLWTG